MLIRGFLIIALLSSSLAYADSFDVQIGAFRDPDVNAISLPASVGELRSIDGADGLTRFLVGPFSSRADADRIRDRLRASGYPGAFVRASSEGERRTAPTAVVTESTDSQSTSDTRGVSVTESEIERIERLKAEQDGEVVYLDGRLHRKVGERFIPVRD